MKEIDSFQRKLLEVKRMIDDDNFRRRVLTLCEQTEPKSFDEYSSSGSFRKLEKFESSTYSEVLKAVDLADNNKPVVMKIMRSLSKGLLKMLPALSSKGCQSYNDILNELVVTQALSQLHEGVLLNGVPSSLYKTHFFCMIHEIKVVSGSMEKTLSKSKREHAKAKSDRGGLQPERKPAPDSKVQQVEPSTSGTAGTSGEAGAPSGAQTTSTSTVTTTTKLSANFASMPGSNASLVEPSQKAPSFAEAKRQFDQQQRDENQQDEDLETGGKNVAAEREENADSNRDEEVKETGEQRLGAGSARKVKEDKEEDKDEGEAEKNKQRSGSEEAELMEDDRMLVAALPHEYVVSVMRHDGQPLWWMMTHKKLTPEQLTTVLVQVIVGLAIAEHVYLYEHRDLHVSNILIKRTSNQTIPFVVDGRHYQVVSHGVKATIIDATFSRLTHNNKVYFRDLTSTLRSYGAKRTPPRMSLQNRSYRQMVRLTKNNWQEFTPKTNLIWLTYLCETLMKNEVMKTNVSLSAEVKKIRDHTLKAKTTLELLSCFPFERANSPQNNTRNNK